MKILLFPGSFSPMHFGHLKLLRAAIEEVKPNVSVVSPIYKSSVDQPDFATRCEICRAAINNTLPLPLSEMVEVGTFHLTKDDSSQIGETVSYYTDFYKQEGIYPEMWILLGKEGAKEANRWKFAKGIATVANISASRDVEEVDAEVLKKRGFVIKKLPFKPSPITSEKVRDVLASGQQDHPRYVPRAVHHLLEERGLYGVRATCPR